MTVIQIDFQVQVALLLLVLLVGNPDATGSGSRISSISSRALLGVLALVIIINSELSVNQNNFKLY
jgi:hypothetical protein